MPNFARTSFRAHDGDVFVKRFIALFLKFARDNIKTMAVTTSGTSRIFADPHCDPAHRAIELYKNGSITDAEVDDYIDWFILQIALHPPNERRHWQPYPYSYPIQRISHERSSHEVHISDATRARELNVTFLNALYMPNSAIMKHIREYYMPIDREIIEIGEVLASLRQTKSCQICVMVPYRNIMLKLEDDLYYHGIVVKSLLLTEIRYHLERYASTQYLHQICRDEFDNDLIDDIMIKRLSWPQIRDILLTGKVHQSIIDSILRIHEVRGEVSRELIVMVCLRIIDIIKNDRWFNIMVFTHGVAKWREKDIICREDYIEFIHKMIESAKPLDPDPFDMVIQEIISTAICADNTILDEICQGIDKDRYYAIDVKQLIDIFSINNWRKFMANLRIRYLPFVSAQVACDALREIWQFIGSQSYQFDQSHYDRFVVARNIVRAFETKIGRENCRDITIASMSLIRERNMLPIHVTKYISAL